MVHITIAAGTEVERWRKNNPVDRVWVMLRATVDVDATYANGAYTYTVDGQKYTVPACMASGVTCAV